MEYEFETTIDTARSGGAFVVVPDEVVEALGGGGRVPVRVWFDGQPYRGSVVTMGGVRCIGVLKAIRAQLGKQAGDPLHVRLVADADERTVEVPRQLRDALATRPVAREFFYGLAFTYRKEYAAWIATAKRPATRDRRLARALEMLEAGKKL